MNILFLTLALATVAAEPHDHTTYCGVQVTPRTGYGPTSVHVQLEHDCKGIALIRKRSTINPQLIVPVGSWWVVTQRTGWNVWVQTWEIEAWSGTVWKVVYKPGSLSAAED